MFNFLRGGAFILVIILFNIISLQAQSLSSVYEGPYYMGGGWKNNNC